MRPCSAFALHPLYISLSETAETMALLGVPLEDKTAGGLVRAEQALNRKYGKSVRVPFEAVLQAKLAALRAAWDASRDFCEPLAEAFAARESWAKPYACFISLKEKFGLAPWWEWPEWKTVSPADIDALWFNPELAEEARFRLWLQVLAREQLQRAAQTVRDMGVDIMGDIPILLAKDSADVWFQRDIFILDRQAGAPPDMYSPRGQYWGFPLYDWDALRAQDYAFWRRRLGYADRFYTAYRIDHVLGFFRIWAISAAESDAYIGAFEPSERVGRDELISLGFSDERIRWLSKPHVPEWKIQSAEKQCLDAVPAIEEPAGAAQPVAEQPVADRKAALARRLVDLRAACFVRIKEEPLFLFNPEIRGTADIFALFQDLRRDFPEASHSLDEYARRMGDWWIDRALYEVEPDQYVFQWSYHDTTSWKSLAAQEQAVLEGKAAALAAASLEIWEKRGRDLLSMLVSATDMQPFAEDLGAVPALCPQGLAGDRNTRSSGAAAGSGDGRAPASPIFRSKCMSLCRSPAPLSTTRRTYASGGRKRQTGRSFGPCLQRWRSTMRCCIPYSKAASAGKDRWSRCRNVWRSSHQALPRRPISSTLPPRYSSARWRSLPPSRRYIPCRISSPVIRNGERPTRTMRESMCPAPHSPQIGRIACRSIFVLSQRIRIFPLLSRNWWIETCRTERANMTLSAQNLELIGRTWLKRTFDTSWFLLKIMVPVSLFVALLGWSGLLEKSLLC